MPNTLYRFVKASEINIEYGKKYFAKRADDETIQYTGWFQKSDGVFFWDYHPGYVPMRKDQYDILLILEEVKEADQQDSWQRVVANVINEWTNPHKSVTYQDVAEILKSKYTLIPKQ